MEMRRFLSIEKMEQISAHKDPHRAQSGEDHGKGKADLSHELEGHSGIVPDIPAHDLIDDDPGDKFTGDHEDDAPSNLLPQRRAPVGPDSLLGAEDQAEPAQHEHGPVGKAAEKHFECIVE